jgi:hypothetical protein
VARSVHDLAVLRGRLGDHAEAVTLHRRALAARVAALGADHPEVLQSLDDLGHEHRAHDELAAAAEVDEQALALRERVLRAGHTVARAADERFRTAGARGAARSTAVRAWLGH